MSRADLIRQGVTALGRAMQAGELSGADLVEACLAEIAARDGELHAFVEVYGDEALARAAALDAERAAGTCRGPLHAIPVAVKDLADIAGRVTGFGSLSYSAEPADGTAAFIEALERAGAIVIGKTQLVEFAFGSWGTNHVLGTPLNPAVHGQASPGGSSSGSAVAVAAGMVPAAIGSDTGGSVRIPAGLCGVAGLKTSHGLVSLERVAPLSPALDTIGPFSCHPEDMAPLLEALGAAPGEEDLPQDGAGTVYRRVDAAALDPVDPGILAHYERTLESLAEAGARVEPLALPCPLAEYQSRCGAIMAHDAYAHLKEIVEDYRRPVDPYVRGRIAAGRDIAEDAHAAALARREADRAAFAEVFGPRDILVLPTTPLTAQPLAAIDERQFPMSRYTRLANYIDLCAVSVPVGSSEGAPVGLQFVARRGRDFALVAEVSSRQKALADA
ncbi:amidase [Kaustia mangrovi]|uniref:Indoleacetamide hydrolase n=1 Tax=Kaustia mangrovi TaxID=2593653 RepID=A0A7S8C401_9HYPH|nr:amidase [Kaustia mangrovi]QPC42947.1 amidase [Kaustia mangrovi]